MQTTEEVEKRKAETAKVDANLEKLTEKFNQLQQKGVGLEAEIKAKVRVETDLWTHRQTDRRTDI